MEFFHRGLLQRIPLGLGSSLGLGLDLEIEGVQWAMDMDLEDLELLKLVPLAGFVCLCYCLSLGYRTERIKTHYRSYQFRRKADRGENLSLGYRTERE
jgi:hypothetical protein